MSVKVITTKNQNKAIILNAMAKYGRVLVPIEDLRDDSEELSKSEFDKALIGLSEDGVLALTARDFVSDLSLLERSRMLKVGKQYFQAVSFRR